MRQFYFSIIFFTLSFVIKAQSTTGTSTEVGITDGQLSVSLSGAANYTVPISVPRGINNVEPKISLTYNSQGSNGTAGFGWEITGISGITRIASSKFHDGTIDPVDFDALDRFALDGQRLILKTGVYGEDGAVYQTENFSNIKVTSYGVHPNGTNYGPKYFKVEYPDGSISYYGNSSDSRSIMAWSITTWEDSKGVSVNYNYTVTNNDLNISSILYGNVGSNTDPINAILFSYVSKKRPEQSYIAGQSILKDKLLSEIAVFTNTIGYRKYALAYDETYKDYQRLITITEKNGDNSKSYNPTVFKYGDLVTTGFVDTTPATLNSSNIDYGTTGNISGDFDGDGNTDIILYPLTTINAKKKYWLYNNITAAIDLTNLGIEHNVGAFEEIFPMTMLEGSSLSGFKMQTKQGWATKQGGVFTTYTFDGYGIVQQDQKTYTFPRFILDYQNECGGENPDAIKDTSKMLSTQNGSGLISYHFESDIPKTFISGDFNGDSLTDVVAIERSFTYPWTSGCTTTERTYYSGKTLFLNFDKRESVNFATESGNISNISDEKLIVADFNGDGKSDIYVIGNGKVSVYSLNDDNQFVLLSQTLGNDPNIVFNKLILMGDYNGDGKADFVIPTTVDQDSWNFYISTGVGFNKIVGTIGINYSQSQIKKYDLEIINNNNWTTSLNEISFIAFDANGDGKTDILCQQNFTVEKDDSGAPNPRPHGTPQMTKFHIAQNMLCTETDVKFLPSVTLTFGAANIKRFPIPIFASMDALNKSPKYSLISDNKIYSFHTRFNKFDVLLNKITTGNGVTQTILYKPLDVTSRHDQYSVYFNSSLTENYPNVDILNDPNFLVVSMLEKKSSTTYKKKLFQYFGAVSNLEGLGFLGFRGTMQTNWYEDGASTSSIISNVSKFDIGRRGANSENYSGLGVLSPASVVPVSYISKSVITHNLYSDALLSNKVFKLKTISSEEFNGLTGTSREITTEYDDYNSPLKVTTIAKEGQSVIQTNIVDVTYENIPSSHYMVGRPSTKTTSATLGTQVMKSEELYYYGTDDLLSKTKTKGDATTNYVVEDLSYDSFGNITKKVLTAGTDSREISLEYDSAGVFLKKSIDIEGLATTFEYNLNGTLKSKTNPFLQTTLYEYDSWFKKTKETDHLDNVTTYDYENSNGTTILTKTASDGSVDKETFDDLGRKTRTGIKNIMGTYSYISYLYDIHDRTYKVSEPYIGESPTEWNESKYDEYGRLLQTISFTGKTTDISSPVVGLTTTITDGTKSETYKKNALGKVISMSDGPSNTINYTYYPNGNLSKINYGGIETKILHDGWGRKKEITDPSAGTFKYTYNDFGDLIKEENANGITSYNLTSLGKLDTKTVSVNGTTISKTTYTYNSDKLLIKTKYEDLANGTNTIITDYKYDTSKRISTKTETTPYAIFIKRYKYDGAGRLEYENSTAKKIGTTVSSTRTVRNTYRNGVHYQILDSITNNVVWQTNSVNSRGQLLTAKSGPAAITNAIKKGFVSQIKYDRITPSANILTLDFDFNSTSGNLLSRSAEVFDWEESFEYDSKDRLTKFNNTQGVQETQAYDVKGRITQNDLGSYNYNIVDKPYQNSSVTVLPQAKAYYENRGRMFFDDMEIQTGWTAEDNNPLKFNYTIFSYNGQKALNLTTSGTTYQNNATADKVIKIDNAVDTEYTLSGWVISSNPKAQISLQEFKNDPYPFKSESVSTKTTNEWKYLEKKILVPADVKELRIRLDVIGSQTLTGNASFDDVKLIKTSAINAQKELNITYNTFKSPLKIEEAGIEIINFTYNDDNQRSTMFYGGVQPDKLLRPLRKHYSADGTMEIKENKVTGSVEFVTYIGGDGYSAPAVVKSDGVTQNYLYLQRDYQGSIVAITDVGGTIVEKRLFDAWGDIVKVIGSAGNSLVGLTVLDRGYTGHEHIQSVGIINMNGRLYDPKLRRFLQPDNNIQDPFNPQNYNRYGYVLNNPLKYTDQSGEFWQFIAGFVFSTYVQGGAASGEVNPLKWNLSTWMTAFTGTASSVASGYATGRANSYIENYSNKPTLGASATNPGINAKYIRSYKSNEVASVSRYDYSSIAYAGVVTTGLVADDVTGIGIADDVLIPVAWGTAATVFVWDNREVIKDDAREIVDAIHRSLNPNDFHYVTYTKTSLDGKLVYVGRSSGYGTPESIVKRRDADHHIKGYGKAELSSSLPATIIGGYTTRGLDPSYWAIRGSEQIQIENWRKKGMSGNSINGIGPGNGNIIKYIEHGFRLLY
ncbi:FG-GAP-like repeat-containing protein [Flavobacterium tructae]|uniref:FG-GAP-like repeat-containing protein n=1 Tax=Flavobacterium tructae TaxID=1114873 RepID=UPI002551E0BD|nr:FG-GAP-like repeat-containing protein [Flavobacterium tructae]MDL2141712.1 FG-GAP-like repeat-containing protein [Flavobacterium tructae]